MLRQGRGALFSWRAWHGSSTEAMSYLQMGQPPLVLSLQPLVCCTTSFIFWQGGEQLGVAALADVQRLDHGAGCSGGGSLRGLCVAAACWLLLVIKPQPELLHLVVVVFSVVAGDTQVIILGKTGAGQHSKIQAIQHLHILLGLQAPFESFFGPAIQI